MSLDREIEALAMQRREAVTQKMRRLVRLMVHRRRLLAYRGLFFDENGALREDAAIVLDHLGEVAGLGRALGQRSDSELQFAEGQRHVALTVIDWLDIGGAKAAEVARKIRETDKT